MSIVNIQHSNPTSDETALSEKDVPDTQPSPSALPSHIHLTPPDVSDALIPPPVVSPFPTDNPFDSPPLSPTLSFYTAPSTPITSPQGEDPPLDPLPPPAFCGSSPPSSPPVSHHSFASVEIETIPPPEALSSPDFALDFTLDDEGLSTLEKIYLFSRSRSAHHRVFISHALPAFLAQVSPLEAVEYVLPLLPNLAVDEDEAVKEALSAELVSIMWWFLTHCRLVEEPIDLTNADFAPQPVSNNEVTLISVQAFTPILATLLLSSNGVVSGSARFAIVELLAKMHKADEMADQHADDSSHGLFGRHERGIFEEEIIQQVVIGMGRLESDENDADDVWYTPAIEVPQPNQPSPSGDSVNPYFPTAQTPPSLAISVPATLSIPSVFPLPSPPVGVPPPHHEAELADMDTSPMAVISYQLEEASHHSPLQAISDGPLEDESVSATGPVDSAHSDISVGPQEEEEEVDPGEQAAVGRLSSMSLIAAVVAGGTPRVDTQCAFVREVERVGQDPVYWVRREASFALGALAKVVPDELIIGSLLPVFEYLRADPAWHVRHSSLFALPALLSRLPSRLRRSVALSTILPLSRDESAPVRSGVLEALGEVFYAFHDDECGPPDELLRLFLGMDSKRLKRDHSQSLLSLPQLSMGPMLELIDDDPARPLACAFNYPAVALTLGRGRWPELRGLYLTLAQNRSSKIRRTLAASVGDLARIIGPDNAQRDLMGVWWDAMRSEDDNEIKLKAIEAVPLFVEALGEGQAREEVIVGLLNLWEEGWLRYWRAREGVIKIIVDLSGGPERPDIIRALLKKGFEDEFGVVRDAAISVICRITCSDAWRSTVSMVNEDILSLAKSPSFRRRMTFVACQQALASSGGGLAILADDAKWQALEQLSDDSIVGVRIGIARLAGSILDDVSRGTAAVPKRILDVIDHLRQDSSPEVRSYIPSMAALQQGRTTFPPHSDSFLTFSRPPPLLRS